MQTRGMRYRRFELLVACEASAGGLHSDEMQRDVRLVPIGIKQKISKDRLNDIQRGRAQFIGVIGRSEEELASLVNLLEDFGAVAPRHGIEGVVVSSLSFVEIDRAMEEIVIQYARMAAGYVAELTQTMVANRRAYEEVHDKYTSLEKFIARNSSNIVTELVPLKQWTSSDESNYLDITASAISQLLPCSSADVAFIELGVSALNRANLNFLASLYVGGSNVPHCNWRVSPDSIDLESGRVCLGLSEHIPMPPRDVRLDIQSISGQPLNIKLACTPPVANPKYCILDPSTAEELYSRSIAIGVWVSPRGISLASEKSRFVTWPTQIFESSYSTYLGPMELRRLRSLSDNAWANGFSAVHFDLSTREVCLHPPRNGETVAEIRDIARHRKCVISYDAIHAHESGKEIEFLLEITNPRRSEKTTEVIGTTDWVGIAPGQRKRVFCEVDGPVKLEAELQLDWLSLRLSTRVKSEGDNDFAWARAANFHIETLDQQ